MSPDPEVVENEVEDGAQASEASDSAESETEFDTQGFERPMTYGYIDKKSGQ